MTTPAWLDAMPVPAPVEAEPLDVLPAPPSRIFRLIRSSPAAKQLLAGLAEVYGVSAEEEVRRDAAIRRGVAAYDARQAAMEPGERVAALAELRAELIDNGLVDQI
jgi:hypothetical protein